MGVATTTTTTKNTTITTDFFTDALVRCRKQNTMDVSTVVCVGPSKKTNNKTLTQSVLRLCERILVKTNKKHERGVGESEKVYKICILYAVWMTEKLITTGVSQLNG